MVIDYSEKKRTVRESMERKPVQKNRPRKEPVGLFTLLSVVVLVATFGAGVLTGWLLFKGPRKAAPAAVAAQQPAKKDEAAPAPPKPGAPDAPLTFYKTLPAGGKGVIGSGLNPKKPEPASPHAAAPHTAPVAAPAALPAADDKQQAARFIVQVASYRDKQEAEAAQAKLSGKGVAAYLVETKLPDNGVWYRVRVGKHLTKAEAEELAGKAAKGALVLPE